MTDYGNRPSHGADAPLPPPRPAAENVGIAKALPLERRPPQMYVCIALTAVLTGVTASLLFGDAPGVGLNITLVILLFFAGWYAISRQAPVPVWRMVCAGAAVSYGILMALRASDILFTVNVLLAVGFTCLSCTPSYTNSMKKAWATMVDLLQVALNFLLGWIFMLTEFPWKRMRLHADRSAVVSRVMVGIAISIPFLVVFGLLFARAETRFGQIFDGLFTWIIPMVYEHFWITFWVTIFSLGLLQCAFISASMAETDYDAGRPGMSIGIVESITVLSLLNGMFLIFVATQLPYLFGGQDRVSATPGLRWSEYARSGFFELAWVAALLIPTLMLFMNVTRAETSRQRTLLFSLCGGLTVLGGIIIVSALQRMLLYTANFGLTELRIYVSTFIVMLACILVLLNVLNYLGRSGLFLPAALAMGVVFSIGIQTLNIQGIIAKNIINRHLSGSDGDMGHMRELSSDAVPAIAMSGLPAAVKAESIKAIVQRDTAGRTGFNWIYQPLSVRRALQTAR